MKTENKPTKKHGGHITGFRADISAGSGPTFEIRRALDAHDRARGGVGYSQSRLSDEIGMSVIGLRKCELEGRWPKGRAVQSNLRGLAEEAGIDLSAWPLPDAGGVFL